MLKFLREPFPFSDSAVKRKGFVLNKALWSCMRVMCWKCLGLVYLIFTVAKRLSCSNIFSVIFKSTVALSPTHMPCPAWLRSVLAHITLFPSAHMFHADTTVLYSALPPLLLCSLCSLHSSFPQASCSICQGGKPIRMLLVFSSGINFCSIVVVVYWIN